VDVRRGPAAADDGERRRPQPRPAGRDPARHRRRALPIERRRALVRPRPPALVARIAFAGTEEGLFRSLDGGLSWERLEPPGLLSRDVTDLASAEWGLVAASSNGVFLSADSGASFRELYAGLDERDVRRVATGLSPLAAFAATGRGLFTYRAPESRARRLKALSDIRTLIDREPQLPEVAQAALAYSGADVPLADWRRRAALAAYAPRVTLRYAPVNPTGSGFVERSVFPDPLPGQPSPAAVLYDTLRQTDALQVLVLWDLERLLFNGASIDASSTFRRAEKHRERLLKRIVSTYDARRRLQVALIQTPPGDLRTLAFKTLQVAELTSVLDGLTDGFFSAALAAPSPARTRAAGPSRSSR
jgi:hypothetical protein